jgi:hypothetical protein
MLPSGLVNLACRRTWHTFPRVQQDDLCIEILQTKSWVTEVTTTLQCDFTGSQPWEGARMLSSFLATEKHELFLSGNHVSGNNSRVSVVELGSGCGIVGITALASVQKVLQDHLIIFIDQWNPNLMNSCSTWGKCGAYRPKTPTAGNVFPNTNTHTPKEY